MDVLEQHIKMPPPGMARTVEVEVDERAARRSLREQIAKLERELAQAFVSAYPRDGLEWSVPSQAGPRLLSLGELERVRDGLAGRLNDARGELGARAESEEECRRLIERMMLAPERHRWARVSREDIGERGCGHWHVRPRLGLIGMMMGWWQVKLSSGCPLPRGSRRDRDPAPPHLSPLLDTWAVAAASAPCSPPSDGRPRRARPRRRGVAPAPVVTSARRRRGDRSRSSSCAS